MTHEMQQESIDRNLFKLFVFLLVVLFGDTLSDIVSNLEIVNFLYR
jgi:hypothetical protein